MRCALLSLAVSMICVWGSISARDIPLVRKHPNHEFQLSLRNGSHVQPRNGAKQELPCETYSLFPGSSEILTSPNYPFKYPNNFECTWTFVPLDGATLTLWCPDFQVKPSRNCRRDFLTVIDGATLDEKYCGFESVYEYDITGVLEITFKTNRRGREWGFLCEVIASNPASSGTSTISGSTSSDDVSSTEESGETTTESSGGGGDGCKCGVRNTVSRIVGGVETTKNEYPWQIALVSSGSTRPFCGGSIISDQWILTAAHCVDGQTPSNELVVIGEHDWSIASETNSMRMKISQVIMHENYNSNTLNNDIALVKLAEKIIFPQNNLIAPVCLATPGNLYEAVSATITGWGTLSQGGSQPYQLNEVTVPTMTNTACTATGYDTSEITNNMICAGVGEGGKDSCQGDSGGPMVTPGSSASMQQIGIVSWGYGCADSRYPGVYTRVSNYVSWINDKITGSTTCAPA